MKGKIKYISEFVAGRISHKWTTLNGGRTMGILELIEKGEQFYENNHKTVTNYIEPTKFNYNPYRHRKWGQYKSHTLR